MNEYKFEYSDQKYAYKLIAICIMFLFLIIGGIFSISKFISKEYFLTLFFMIGFGIPFLIFWLNRKKIIKIGYATLENDKVKFKLENDIKKIEFNQIENYLVQVYNGTMWHIKLANGQQFKIYANSNFCNTTSFDEFSSNLETKILDFKNLNNINITRRKTLFERAWIYPLILIMTFSLVLVVLYAVWKGKNIPIVKLITVIFPILSLWIAYYTAKIKTKKE